MPIHSNIFPLTDYYFLATAPEIHGPTAHGLTDPRNRAFPSRSRSRNYKQIDFFTEMIYRNRTKIANIANNASDLVSANVHVYVVFVSALGLQKMNSSCI